MGVIEIAKWYATLQCFNAYRWTYDITSLQRFSVSTIIDSNRSSKYIMMLYEVCSRYI